MKNNTAKDYVYKTLKELSYAINWDSFNLTRDQQSFLDNKLAEFKKILDEAYFANLGE
jgi:hypothetical protein